MAVAPPTIAVVIPTLNEAQCIADTLQQALAHAFDEYVVVDGGSTDGTPEIVRALPAAHPTTCLLSTAGRAVQMNTGAAAVRSDVVLFLHADTRLPTDARRAIQTAMQDPACVGGRFDVQFDRHTLVSRTISALMNRRSRWTGMMTGDQAMFVRTVRFGEVGGFATIPLMEDLDLSRRLKRLGPIAALRARVTTSYRRWERDGPIRTIVRMWALRFAYWLGVTPATLARHYRPVR
ncbi:MAG: TIGR04283 family arsenosugar biosynthesis glycosyltransferase [Nitrospiraceae bacterium]